MSDQLQALIDRLPRLGDAVLVTLELTLAGAALAMVVALLLGFGSRARTLWVRGPSRVVVEFFRGTSLVVQLFWIFYVLPAFGYEMEALAVGIVALGLNYGAYASEVVRGSIGAVPAGQWEAATALNMGWLHRVRRVIFPQAWALMIPMLANLLIQLVKGSALAYYITLHDLNFWIVQLRRGTSDTLFSYGVGLLVYFAIAYVLTMVMNWLERRAKRRLGQLPPRGRPTLGQALRIAPEVAVVQPGPPTAATASGDPEPRKEVPA